MFIRDRSDGDRQWIETLLCQRWGGTVIVVHGEAIDVIDLPAVVTDDRTGLATYRLKGEEAEITTLDAVKPGRGIGTSLLAPLVLAAGDVYDGDKPGDRTLRQPIERMHAFPEVRCTCCRPIATAISPTASGTGCASGSCRTMWCCIWRRGLTRSRARRCSAAGAAPPPPCAQRSRRVHGRRGEAGRREPRRRTSCPGP